MRAFPFFVLASATIAVGCGTSGMDDSDTTAQAVDTYVPTWTHPTAPGGPTSSHDAQCAYDPALGKVVFFGGNEGASTPTSDGSATATYTWDGKAWAVLASAAASPPPRGAFAMAYDEQRKKTVLFGGRKRWQFNLGDTWELDAAGWSQRTTPVAPPARAGLSMAYDRARQRTILFGGSNGNGLLGDTWEWDGTSWKGFDPPSFAASSLPHQIGRAEADGWSANVAQDPAGYLQFGPYTTAIATGRWNAVFSLLIDNAVADNAAVVTIDVNDADGGGVLASRTINRKEWNAAGVYQDFTLPFQVATAGHRLEMRVSWLHTAYVRSRDVKIVSTAPPSIPARWGAGMAYDANLAKVVAYGGLTQGSVFTGDLYTYEGAGRWQSVFYGYTGGPGKRESPTLAFDPARSALVVFGGEKNDGPTPATQLYDTTDLWTYAGPSRQWSQVAATGTKPPPGFAYHTPVCLAYDTSRSTLVAIQAGGAVWEMQYVRHANQPPVFDAVADQSVFANDTLSFGVKAHDPDDASPSISASGLPAGATFDAASGTLRWTPAPGDAGDHVVTFTASDGALSVKKNVTIHVSWFSYPMLPSGSFDLRGSVSMGATQEDCGRRTGCERAPINVGIACTFAGTNPGKVTATCTARPQTTFWNPEADTGVSVVQPDGSFALTAGPIATTISGRVTLQPGDEHQLTITGYQARLNPVLNLYGGAAASALLAPFP